MLYISAAKLVAGRLNGGTPPAWKLAALSFRDRKGSDGLVRAFDAYPLNHTVFMARKRSPNRPLSMRQSLMGKI
jgi:hypothetical protein